MCGIAGVAGTDWGSSQLLRMTRAQQHRGPDGEGLYTSEDGQVGLGHRRLSILDLSDAGRQPMSTPDGRLTVILNGEIYNYLELRDRLPAGDYRTATDTEVLLRAWQTWGPECLQQFIGMFAFALWDDEAKTLYCVRDRFGVKPLHYHLTTGGDLTFASEIPALFQGGVPKRPDLATWAAYLSHGLHDHGSETFWEDIRSLRPGHYLQWKGGRVDQHQWYDVVAAVEAREPRAESEVLEEYTALLEQSVRFRFRSDVPVAINLSGGLDSSTLLGVVDRLEGDPPNVAALTFVTGDPSYDELPWVERMLHGTAHELITAPLASHQVPTLTQELHELAQQPLGGVPTLAYARLFEEAKGRGITVLLDGQGMDEQWAGYDYYRNVGVESSPLVQGSNSSPVRSGCLREAFLQSARPFQAPRHSGDSLRDLQFRDLSHTKIPRALRFNDTVSMRSSTELREPFLDHRLVEIAISQPADRKIRNGTGKYLLRRIASDIAPAGIAESPKRPVQTPQREWLRGPLAPWVESQLDRLLEGPAGDWFRPAALRSEWEAFQRGDSDNSFYVWQWISAAALLSGSTSTPTPQPVMTDGRT